MLAEGNETRSKSETNDISANVSQIPFHNEAPLGHNTHATRSIGSFDVLAAHIWHSLQDILFGTDRPKDCRNKSP